MSLARTSLLNGIAVATRMCTGIALNKILALYVGPAGYAIIGQLQNIIAMVLTFAAGALNTGVTKYTAEYHDAPERQLRLWRTAASITLIGSVIFGLLLAVLRERLAVLLLGNSTYADALGWLAGCLTLISVNALLLAILSGKKDVKRFITANISGSLISFAVSGLLAWQMGLAGALTALSLGQAASLVATLLVCRRLAWFHPSKLIGRIDRGIAANLARFIVMALTSAAAVPVTQILIRNHIVAMFDSSHAGYWDGLNKISTICLSLATTTLSLYYLPRIAEIRDDKTLRQEIWSGYRVIVPIVACAAITVYVLRLSIVKLLFSSDFLPMTSLMAWQLTGDVIKIASWLLGYVLIGKAMMKTYVVTEVVFSASLYLLTIAGTREFGYQGVSIAYAVNYAIYLATMYWIILGRRPVAQAPLIRENSSSDAQI